MHQTERRFVNATCFLEMASVAIMPDLTVNLSLYSQEFLISPPFHRGRLWLLDSYAAD
jgi:hypothetical protein